MTHRPIPEIRARLHELAVELDCLELSELAEATRRKPCARRAAPKFRSLTPELAQEIRAYGYSHPRDSYTEIAAVFYTNIARVSEAITRSKGI
tara:strand:+ start:45 stop:323 length:279 start_codon:yes stop_codon:yes gene_type:complete